jgi:hypothetical protein
MEKVEKLEKYAQARFEHNVHKKSIREQCEKELYVAHNGGMFKIDQGLIAFLNAWEDDKIYMIDSYDNPIEVDRKKFLVLAKQAYQHAINTYHTNYEQLRTTRRATQV